MYISNINRNTIHGVYMSYFPWYLLYTIDIYIDISLIYCYIFVGKIIDIYSLIYTIDVIITMLWYMYVFWYMIFIYIFDVILLIYYYWYMIFYYCYTIYTIFDILLIYYCYTICYFIIIDTIIIDTIIIDTIIYNWCSYFRYPLVNIQKAIEAMAIEIVDFPHEKWWFSIAMLNYQRVLCSYTIII
jgi:hypothetical protein